MGVKSLYLLTIMLPFPKCFPLVPRISHRSRDKLVQEAKMDERVFISITGTLNDALNECIDFGAGSCKRL